MTSGQGSLASLGRTDRIRLTQSVCPIDGQKFSPRHHLFGRGITLGWTRFLFAIGTCDEVGTPTKVDHILSA